MKDRILFHGFFFLYTVLLTFISLAAPLVLRLLYTTLYWNS